MDKNDMNKVNNFISRNGISVELSSVSDGGNEECTTYRHHFLNVSGEQVAREVKAIKMFFRSKCKNYQTSARYDTYNLDNYFMERL